VAEPASRPIPLRVDQYDSTHQSGPTITIHGPTGDLVEITLPWSAIAGVIVDHSGKIPVGFAPPDA